MRRAGFDELLIHHFSRTKIDTATTRTKSDYAQVLIINEGEK